MDVADAGRIAGCKRLDMGLIWLENGKSVKGALSLPTSHIMIKEQKFLQVSGNHPKAQEPTSTAGYFC
jgi:hypothetical protein